MKNYQDCEGLDIPKLKPILQIQSLALCTSILHLKNSEMNYFFLNKHEMNFIFIKQ